MEAVNSREARAEGPADEARAADLRIGKAWAAKARTGKALSAVARAGSEAWTAGEASSAKTRAASEARAACEAGAAGEARTASPRASCETATTAWRGSKSGTTASRGSESATTATTHTAATTNSGYATPAPVTPTAGLSECGRYEGDRRAEQADGQASQKSLVHLCILPSTVGTGRRNPPPPEESRETQSVPAIFKLPRRPFPTAMSGARGEGRRSI